ncbi:MAG: hypothetical protein ABI361_12515 [Nitrososphaera sp.]|jgi:hypothetical protein
MASRVLAFAVMSLLLGVLASSTLLSRTASAADTWYVGQGAKPDTYVKYTVQEYDTNQDRPFEIVIYFQSLNNGIWTAPTYIIDQGKVVNATLRLGSNLAVLKGNSDSIPADMNVYLGAYQRSLQWLSAFSPQSNPQSLSAISWGKIACIGCGTLDPAGSETVTVQAGTFQTTKLVNHRGQHDSIIWVNKDLPFPVKATAYADVSSGQPPIQFAYELLDMGTGKPTPPKSVLEAPKPPLQLTTDAGNYKVVLDWNPADIQSGGPTIFSIQFTDIAGNALGQVNYAFYVQDDKGNNIVQRLDQNSKPDGTATQQVTFNQSGAASVKVVINGVAGVPTGEFVESAKFGILVVPEFPLNVVLVLGTVVALVVVVSRTGLAGSLRPRNGF